MKNNDNGASASADRATAVEPVPVSPLRDGISSAGSQACYVCGQASCLWNGGPANCDLWGKTEEHTSGANLRSEAGDPVDQALPVDREAAAELARVVYGQRIARDIADGTIERHHFIDAMRDHRVKQTTEKKIVAAIQIMLERGKATLDSDGYLVLITRDIVKHLKKLANEADDEMYYLGMRDAYLAIERGDHRGAGK